jgi:hypothetical protein
MTVGVSTTNLVNVWLNILRNTAGSAVAQPYVKLHTGDPGSAGANNAAVGSATRNAATFSAPSAGALALSASPTAWTNGGTSETLTHVSVWDASSAGNFLFSAALSSGQAWASTNTFTLTALGLSISPLAA